MSRNIVPRVDKGADLGTAEKNWNKLFVDAVALRGEDLQALLNGKISFDMLMAKGDLYVATGAGAVTRLPKGADGDVLKSNAAVPEGLMWGPAGARQELTEDILVTVGSGGQFSTINAALENIVTLYYPKYISGSNCPRVTISLLPGFVMSEQILVESLDLSWITITGAEAETVINRSALTIHCGNGYPAFAAISGGFLPIVGQLFNMDTSGTAYDRHGIIAYSNSRAIVSGGCGVKNAGSIGICADRSSTINANGANASGAGTHGIYAIRSSLINADGANASGAGSIGIYAVYGSTINAYNANASGAGNFGIQADHSSTINANGTNASGAGTHDICAYHGSLINADGATGTLNQVKNTITANGIIFQQ